MIVLDGAVIEEGVIVGAPLSSEIVIPFLGTPFLGLRGKVAHSRKPEELLNTLPHLEEARHKALTYLNASEC